MKKIILSLLALSCCVVVSVNAEVIDTATNTQPIVPAVIQDTKNNFNDRVVEKVDKKLTELEKTLSDMKNAKLSLPSDASIDKQALPVIQGTYSIKLGDKTLKNEAYAKDSGSAQMYLNGNNNVITKSISSDSVTFQAGNEKIKTPVAHNKDVVIAKTGIKPTINNYSSQKVATPNNMPDLQQVIDNLNKQTPPVPVQQTQH